VASSYFLRLEDMQAAVNKAYIENNIVVMANGQLKFTYDEASLDRIIKYLSIERLAAYLILTKKDRERAIRLYERNTELSEALYGVVQGLEVTLRNAVHNILEADYGQNWHETISLEESEKSAVDEAKRSIADRHETITQGRIVAELTLGFWVRLFSASYAKTLWGTSLKKIVPLRIDRRAIYARLKDMKTLRNRIAHHNRIIGHTRTVANQYEDLIETIGWFSGDTKNWVEQTNCVGERLEKKFPPKPPQQANKPDNANEARPNRQTGQASKFRD
jgi:hypothetical protein